MFLPPNHQTRQLGLTDDDAHRPPPRPLREVAQGVVFSAELGCDYHVPTPPGCAAIPPPPPRRRTAAQGSALAEALPHWANCGVAGPAPCTAPPSYRFLNSGAFAGSGVCPAAGPLSAV